MDKSKGSGGQVAFLLAQVGSHASSMFAERLEALKLTPSDAGILRLLGAAAGISQQALSKQLGMHASRLVALLDSLEERRLLERRPNQDDRRLYSLFLTEQGVAMLRQVGQIARLHGEELCSSLSDQEREQLVELLERIAQKEGLVPNVHPGYRRLAKP
jgi:DNA-binding MarR family transcriptional regulator